MPHRSEACSMEDTESIASLIDSTTSKIQQLHRAFTELENYHVATLNLKWKHLEEHFHGLDKSLKRRFHEFEFQEKEYETRTIESQRTVEKRKSVLMAKEEALLDRLQETRDAAVSAVSNALAKHDYRFCMEPSVQTVVGKNPPVNMIFSAENGNFHVLITHPQLVKLCQEMDSVGLHNFISDNSKDIAIIREEIPIALKAAAEPAALVLDSLKGFYSLERKKDSVSLNLRRICIMLMECLSILLTNMDLDLVCNIMSEDIKERAKGVAEEWKRKMEELDVGASNGNSLEAHAFLQLVATFGIKSDFDWGYLSQLIPMVSRRRQTADLCRSLGLTEKISGNLMLLF